MDPTAIPECEPEINPEYFQVYLLSLSLSLLLYDSLTLSLTHSLSLTLSHTNYSANYVRILDIKKPYVLQHSSSSSDLLVYHSSMFCSFVIAGFKSMFFSPSFPFVDVVVIYQGLHMLGYGSCHTFYCSALVLALSCGYCMHSVYGLSRGCFAVTHILTVVTPLTEVLTHL